MQHSVVNLYKTSASRKTILLFIAVLLPFFKPGSLAELNIQPIEIAYAVAKVAVTLGATYYFVRAIRSPKDALLVSALVLAGLVLVSTMINGQSIRNWLGQWAPRFAIVLLSYCAMKKKPIEFIAAALSLSTVFCVVNLLTIVAFPEGLYQTPSTFLGDNFFLGHRNGVGLYILLMLVSSLILDNYSDDAPLIGKRTLALYVVGLVQTLLAFCATTIIALAIFGVGLCMLKNKHIRWVFNPLISVSVGLIGNISILFLRAQTLFAPLIETVLHRDVSLSSRTKIWDITLNLVSGSNSVLGRGVDGYQNIRIRDTVISSAHNELLNIILQSGLLGLAAYIVFIGSVVYQSFAHRKSALGMIAALYLVTILAMGITYITTTTATFLALSILYYSMKEKCE